MIVAHPFRGFLTFGIGQLGLTPEKASERPLFRGGGRRGGPEQQGHGERKRALPPKVAGGLGLPQPGGSDAHEISEVGMYATRFPDGSRTNRI